MKKILLLAATLFCFTNIINAQPGKLDPSFATNGIVTTDLGQANAVGTNSANQMLLLPDGDMYLLQGEFGVISKRHADGSLDSSFGVNGFAESISRFAGIIEMAIASDGKVVTIGWDSYSQSSFIGRCNTNGTWDSSFANNGKFITTE